uniref:Uncharacterized protein n=1 Tax=viral metagenome TaxID=1070528 RepID=A0A6C0DZX6_9ZZZZ
MNETNVDNLLEKWYEAKQQINDLESKINNYKRIAENIMEHKNVESLMNDKFLLQKKDINKTTISKKDLPIEIWNKYSKENFYSAFYISKANEKKKRSIRRSKKRI